MPATLLLRRNTSSFEPPSVFLSLSSIEGSSFFGSQRSHQSHYGSIVAASSFTTWESGVSAYTSGYRWEILLANASGNYNVVLTDAYGDGWAWNNATGSDAFVAAGSDVVGGPVTIGLTSGFTATGEFTVTPAPGALALLGLAGLAGRRKRA